MPKVGAPLKSVSGCKKNDVLGLFRFDIIALTSALKK